MTNGRVPFYHHSTLRNAAAMRELYPVPEIWIYPDVAKAYGIATWRLGMGRIQARQDPCESTGHKGNQSGNGMYGAFLASGDDEYKDAWLAGDKRQCFIKINRTV